MNRNPICYVVVGPRVRGKFNVERAKALGVPNGPLRGQLTQGKTITFTVTDTVTGEDGVKTQVPRTVTVTPEECMGEPEPPCVAIVLDVPTKEHIPSLVQQFKDTPLFSKLQSRERREHVVRVLFHHTGDGVLEDLSYIEFMKGFGEDVHHVVGSRGYCPNTVTFTNAATNQLRLNRLDEDIFPVQHFEIEAPRTLSGMHTRFDPAHLHLIAIYHRYPQPPDQYPPHDLEHESRHPPSYSSCQRSHCSGSRGTQSIPQSALHGGYQSQLLPVS